MGGGWCLDVLLGGDVGGRLGWIISLRLEL